ncbi:MAG: zinc ribbon domain-containing protein [Acutalibacteraceae bacterium]
MYCKNCGFKMEDGFQVCPQCGTKKGLGNAYCGECGAVRSVGSAFCTQCGSKYEVEQPVTVGAINENKEQVQPQQPTAQQFQAQPQQPTAQQFQAQPQQNGNQFTPPAPAKKYCRNCGSEILPGQVVCTKCGTKVGEGTAFCPHCASPVQPGAAACMNCGRSIKHPFDFAKYIKEFGNNFVSLFKQTDKMAMIFDNFVNFASVLVFIFMLLPVAYVSVSIFSYSTNAFGVNGFAGFMFILALLSAIIKYEPFCAKFMQEKPQIGKFYVFLTPALELIGVICLMISTFAASASAGSYAYLSSYISVGFTFAGWILILLVAASIADAVYLFIKNNKKTV